MPALLINAIISTAYQEQNWQTHQELASFESDESNLGVQTLCPAHQRRGKSWNSRDTLPPELPDEHNETEEQSL